MPNVERDHDRESTHYACFEMMAKHGGKAQCCACTKHVCERNKTATRIFQNNFITNYSVLKK